ARVLRNYRSVGIAQHYGRGIRQECNRRYRANVESPQVVFSTHIQALKGGRYHTAITPQERCLQVVADRVPFLLHGNEMFVLNNRTKRANRTAQPRNRDANENAGPALSRISSIQ